MPAFITLPGSGAFILTREATREELDAYIESLTPSTVRKCEERDSLIRFRDGRFPPSTTTRH